VRAAGRDSDPIGAVAVAGVAGGLDPRFPPGSLVVADRVTDVTGRQAGPELSSAPLLAAALRRAGLPAHVGTVASSPTLVRGTRARSELAGTGAVAVDMESAALVEPAWPWPTAVVRVITDSPGAELVSASILRNGRRALAALAEAAPVLGAWAAAAGPRHVILAGPRSFCAGVERAIETVERAIERWGAPLYVRRQIVHNRHVVARLEARGAVFVHELDEVPDGSTVVFSAHGVAPAVRAEAARRELRVIDATCPLVAKVHTEVRRFRDRGYQVILIGDAGHDEIEGTLGEADGIQLINDPDDVASITVEDPDQVAYITQTTLAADDTAEVIGALRERFPNLVGPHSSDICYATQNRQDAVRAVAESCDLVLVVGSRNSSNTNRLVEVASRAGCRSELVEDESELDLDWLAGASTVGITAGASAPESLVDGVVAALATLGPLDIEHRSVRSESVSFALPVEVR
jgi:4-hydroxy-3-methylbut-2-enyl diphosphate reductase